MKKAIVFLANGFEEMEATGTVDILRRGGIDTKTVSITDDRKVIGAHNMEYTADATFTEIDLSDADALILPGGMPGDTKPGPLPVTTFPSTSTASPVTVAPINFGSKDTAR